MAACGSLHRIFDNPLPENPSLLESLSSRNQIVPVKPLDQSSFTEIFGELHFEDTCFSSSSSSSLQSPPPSIDFSSFPTNENARETKEESVAIALEEPPFPAKISTSYSSGHKKAESFSSMKWKSLQLCTEGLGSESSVDVEDLQGEMNEHWQTRDQKSNITEQIQPKALSSESRRTKTRWATFPPPISSIGKSGKPWVSFKSYREGGRFVLKEVRTPTQEFLQACREDGRLKLQFVQPNQEIAEEEDDDEEEGDEEDEEKGLADIDNGRKEARNEEQTKEDEGNSPLD